MFRRFLAHVSVSLVGVCVAWYNSLLQLRVVGLVFEGLGFFG